MVWIHGGAFVIGTANDPMYDGAALARRGDVVVVTINYRLGIFGFPYIPGKIANSGSFDQILALEWVRDNINLFGGDPYNVTIFGESAGGYSVVSLCSMPAAKGLFHRVIAESAPFIDPAVTDKPTIKILRKLGIKGTNIEDLGEKSAEEIIAVQNKVFAADPTNIMALRPLIEGDIWPKHPLKAFKDGDCWDIDFMIGTNLDEMKLFTAMKAFSSVAAGGDKLLLGFLGMTGITPENSQKILEAYKEARAEKLSIEPKDLFAAILTDVMFRIPTIRLLEAQSPHQPNTYSYLFTWPSPGLDGILGAAHAIELPFVFGTLDAPTFKNLIVVSPETQALSEKMMDAWIAFARTGNPTHDNIPEWPSYDAENRATMVFGEQCEVVNAPFDKERAAWDGLLEI
jgi:para-nitrobenzyl esterase